MDSRERTLDIGMAKRRVIAFPLQAHNPASEAGSLVQIQPRNQLSAAGAYRVYVIQNREGKFYIGLSDDVDRRRLRGWRVRVIRFSLIRQRIQVTESESIDAGNAPALHLCRCREKLAREIAVYRMQ